MKLSSFLRGVTSLLLFFQADLSLAETGEQKPLSEEKTSSKIPPVVVPEASQNPTERNWETDATISVPFRGFEVQTGAKDAQTQDPLGSVSYSPSPSLEGSIFLSYKSLGFNYRHTLAAASLDSDKGLPASVNEEFRFSLFLERNLFEFSRQNLVGLQTDIETNNSGVKKRIARADISFSDWRARWIGGLPIWGADRPNSLANFYSQAEIDSGQEVSVDLLYEVELMQQKISASSPFVPQERRAVFGTGATLREVSSTGLGAGVGPGFTALMHGKSYFSIAGLLGGNFNISKAHYADREEDVSGFGAFISARMSVQWVFGHEDNQNLGIRLLVDSWTIPTKEEKIASSDAALSLNYGVKF